MKYRGIHNSKYFLYFICFLGYIGDVVLAVSGISTYHRFFIYGVLILVCLKPNKLDSFFWSSFAFLIFLLFYFVTSIALSENLEPTGTYLFGKVLATLFVAVFLNYSIRDQRLHNVMDALGCIVFVNLIISLIGLYIGLESVRIYDDERAARFGVKGWLGVSPNEFSYFVLPVLAYAAYCTSKFASHRFLFLAALATCLLSGLKALLFAATVTVIVLFFNSRHKFMRFLPIAVSSFLIFKYKEELLSVFDYFVFQFENKSLVEFLVSGRFERAVQYLGELPADIFFLGSFPAYLNFELGALDIFANFGLILSVPVSLIVVRVFFPPIKSVFSLAYSFMLAVLFLFSGHMIESMMSLLSLVVLARYFKWERV